jgi:hypothetical protein
MRNILSLLLLAAVLGAAQEKRPQPEPEEEAFVVPDHAETPADVLLIMAMARTLDDIQVLLPRFAQQEARKLLKEDREALLDELALGMLGRKYGYQVKVGKETGLVAYAEKDGKTEIELRVFHEVIGGDTAIVLFGLCSPDQPEKCGEERIQAWMRNEDDSWRLLHLVEAKIEMSLDEAEFFDALRSKAMRKREMHAAEHVAALKKALVAYATAFPERGLPLDLTPVIKAQDASVKGVSVPGGLKCRRTRCVGDGYNFAYEPTGAGYVIMARPARYRLTGELSFAVNQSSEVHCTPDERTPGEHDPVVKNNSIEECREAPKDRPPSPDSAQSE